MWPSYIIKCISTGLKRKRRFGTPGLYYSRNSQFWPQSGNIARAVWDSINNAKIFYNLPEARKVIGKYSKEFSIIEIRFKTIIEVVGTVE